MSWLISTLIAGLVYTSTASYPVNEPVKLDSSSAIIVTAEKNANGDETERFEKTYSLNPNGKVSVSNVNGSITIEAWDKNEVKLVAIKTADSKERLAQLEINIDSTPDSLKIETDYGRWNNGSWSCNSNCRLNVDYQLIVPRGAMLNEIETVNGSVTISDMTNFTRASAVNGTVKATNLQGTAHIETVNGTTEASFERLNDNSKINLSTVNGQVILTIPSDSDATLKAESVNGRIANDFGLTVRKGKYVGRDLYGKVGDGRAKINLESVNGGLNVKRKQDGKNIKPITNLLPAKDEDDADEADFSVDVDGMNQEINKSTQIAVKESLKIAQQAPKITAQAMKDAQKAMAESNKAMQAAQQDMMKAKAEMENMSATDWQDFASAPNDLATSKVEERTQTFKVKGIPNVTVNAKSCPVSVKGWDKDEVMYRVTTMGGASLKPDVNITANQNNSQIVINTIITAKKIKNFTGSYSGTMNVNKDGEILVIPKNAVRMEVFVPNESNLKISTDKEIRVEGIKGSINLDGEEGAINVRDSEGKLKISAADAMIRVLGFTGEVDSRAADGINSFEGEFTKFSAVAGDGTIILTLSEEINADFAADTKIQTEGFNLKNSNEDATQGTLGSGGTKFNFQVGDGQIIVRNAKTLVAKY